jgi:hypothetical protein
MKGDRTLRGFEHVGKAIFCGKVKLSKKERGEPEAEDEIEEDAPDTEVDESGACRQYMCVCVCVCVYVYVYIYIYMYGEM